MPIIFTNNLIAIAIYICVCIVLLPLNVAWEGAIWHDLIWEWGSRGIVFNWTAILVHTIVSLFLCFWAGKKFLRNTNNIGLNAISAVFLVIIIATIIFIFFDEPSPSRLEGLLVVPIYPISETISYFFHIKLKYCYLAISLLPSIAMWLGIVSKKI